MSNGRGFARAVHSALNEGQATTIGENEQVKERELAVLTARSVLLGVEVPQTSLQAMARQLLRALRLPA
jgi:hypothetical protein